MRSCSFIVFKYVILILRKEKYILGRVVIWGDAKPFVGIWGAKANYF